MEFIKVKLLTPEQETEIDCLWDEEYPKGVNGQFRPFLESAKYDGHHLLLDDTGKIVGWAMLFEKDDEVRFTIIVHSSLQGRGFGRRLLEALKSERDEFYGWVVDHDKDVKANGERYHSPLPFYVKNGFEVLEDQRLEAGCVSAVKIKWTKPQA